MGKILSVTIKVGSVEQYFPVVTFIMLVEVVLTFESEVIKCYYSSGNY